MIVEPGIVNKQIPPQDCPISNVTSEWSVTAFGNYDRIKDGIKVSWAPRKKPFFQNFLRCQNDIRTNPRRLGPVTRHIARRVGRISTVCLKRGSTVFTTNKGTHLRNFKMSMAGKLLRAKWASFSKGCEIGPNKQSQILLALRLEGSVAENRPTKFAPAN